MNLCNERSIRGNFNASILPDNIVEGVQETTEYKTVIGKPACTLEKVTFNDINDHWSFNHVSLLIYSPI